MTLKTTFTERLDANPTAQMVVRLCGWISVLLFLRLLGGFTLFSSLLSLFHVNPTAQVTPSAHVRFSGCVPTKKHRGVTTHHIGM